MSDSLEKTNEQIPNPDRYCECIMLYSKDDHKLSQLQLYNVHCATNLVFENKIFQ